MRPAVLQPDPATTLGLSESLETLDTNVVWQIARRARAAPQQTAVADPGNRLTYGELERRSNHLAAYLLEAGAEPEMCIALLLERSCDFVVAALAVLKSGAAYL